MRPDIKAFANRVYSGEPPDSYWDIFDLQKFSNIVYLLVASVNTESFKIPIPIGNKLVIRFTDTEKRQ